MPFAPELAIAFAAGALVAWLLSTALRNRSIARHRLEEAERLSAAEATAESERARRLELEAEHDGLQATVRDLDRRLAVADERVAKGGEQLERQQRFFDEARTQIADAFRALAGEALKGNTEQFLSLAEQKLSAVRGQAAADLEERKLSIEALLGPLREQLEQVQARTRELEKARVEAYSRIDEQVKQLLVATSTLEEKTTSLTTALKSSQVRGRWGEIALRNVAELAGMTAHCDFEEQETLTGGARPDMTVRLPGGRRIAVDAKAPLTAFLEAGSATSEAEREKALERHVRDLRAHVRALASREYAEALGADVDLVVMFLPGDPFLAAAFAKDPELQVEALRSKVLVATPTTLIALLRTVAIYWQQQAMAENAQAIAAAARELYERAAKFGGDLGAVGRGLKTALDAYNRAVGSFDRRLLPMGKRLEDMKIAEQSKRRLEAPEPIEETPRQPIE